MPAPSSVRIGLPSPITSVRIINPVGSRVFVGGILDTSFHYTWPQRSPQNTSTDYQGNRIKIRLSTKLYSCFSKFLDFDCPCRSTLCSEIGLGSNESVLMRLPCGSAALALESTCHYHSAAR